MSIIQEKPVVATIEVAYSDIRKSDMQVENQKTCSLVINIIKHIFQEYGVELQEISIPKNKPRNADIYFDVLLNESQIESIKKSILEKTADSLRFVEVFVDA